MNAHDLLNLICLRDAQDSMTRAIGWVVHVRHVETPDFQPIIYGTFSDLAPAICWAHEFEAGLNDEGETGFRCVPMPVLPAETEPSS